MLYYLSGSELKLFPKLRHSMLVDRKRQFVDRLKWPLNTTPEGYEVDEYDTSSTLYVICADDTGRHSGSMRLIPSSSRTMTEDHFSEIIPGIHVKSDRIWECTRYCISCGAEKTVSFSLMAGAAKLMKERRLTAFLGVFDARMERAYRRFGAPPFVLGSEQTGQNKISIGLWRFDQQKYDSLVGNSKYSHIEYEEMYSSSAIACDENSTSRVA